MTNQTQIQTFNFKSHAIRAEVFNNEPHFCLADVCAVFNMRRRSTEDFNLDPKGCNNIAILTNGGKQELTFINEPNLYRIIFKSRKAEAVEFQNWVFDEVLPQIRKTGKYEKATTTVDDRTGLRDAVNMLVGKKGVLYSDAYNIVHQYMNVKSIEDIAKADLPKAIAYVHKLVLEGELIDTPTTLLPKEESVQVPRRIAEALVKFHRLTIRNAERAEKGLRAIHEIMGYERYHRNDLAAGLFDLHHEFNYWIDAFENITLQNTAPRLTSC